MLQFLTQHIHKLQAVIIKSKSLNKCKLFYFTIKLSTNYGVSISKFSVGLTFNNWSLIIKITSNLVVSCLNSLYLVCDVGVCYDRMQLHTYNHISQKFSNIVLARNDFCFKANCAFTYYDHITEIE